MSVNLQQQDGLIAQTNQTCFDNSPWWQSDELLGQVFSIQETGQQHVLGNELKVRHHHGARSEQSLQVFGQLGSASVARVHCDENGNSWYE